MPGAGASGANYGNVQVQDAELAASLPMTVAGYRCFAELEEELGDSVGFRRRGSLLAIETEAQWQLVAERLPALHRAGIKAELVPAQRLPEIEPLMDPHAVLGASYYPDEGQVNPFKLMQAYLRQGRRSGLTIHSGAEVVGFRSRVGGWRPPHDAGDFSACVAVLATGAWTPSLGRLLGRTWRIEHVHGQALVTERCSETLRNHISSAAFFEAMHEQAGCQAKAVLAVGQSRDGHFLLGEAGVFTEDMGEQATRGARPRSQRRWRASSPACCRSVCCAAGPRPWPSRPMARPFLGTVDGVEGLILATAFKSTVIVTPLVGRMVTQLVLTGRADLDMRAFAPDREIAHG